MFILVTECKIYCLLPHLLAVELGRGLPDPECGRVVAAHLGEAAAAGPRADVVRVGEQVDRLEEEGDVKRSRSWIILQEIFAIVIFNIYVLP